MSGGRWVINYNEFRFGNTESGVYGITCDRETHYILPDQRAYVKEIPGIDGVIDFGIGGYGVRVIPVDIYYDGPYETLRANREKIIAWLSSTAGEYKQLEFGNESGKYYKAKILAALNFSVTDNRKIGSIQFTCNPPWQYQRGVLLTPAQILWNTQDVLDGTKWLKQFSSNGSLRITNSGTMAAKPVITLIGNIPIGIMLSYDGAQWQLNIPVLYDGVVINCAAETVTRLSDGANLYGSVNPSKDDYFIFQPGQIEVSISASGLGAWPLNLTMIIDFTPMNMG
jgi:Phage-related protein